MKQRLFILISCFLKVLLYPRTAQFLVEEPWFFKRSQFHAQKRVLHRASMRRYRDHLAGARFRVDYFESEDLATSTDLFIELAQKGISEISTIGRVLATGYCHHIERLLALLSVHRFLFWHNPRMAPFITYITRMPEEKRLNLNEKAERYLISIGACKLVPRLFSPA